MKRNFLRPALLALLAAEAVALCKDYVPAADFFKNLAHIEAYTEAEQYEDGESRRERGFSIDFKEKNLKFWKAEEIPVRQKD